jgi:GNAT superfamily N-acetyltransferase
MSIIKLSLEAVASPEFETWYLRLLAELAEQGGEVAPVRANARRFCSTLATLVSEGRGVVVAAIDEDGEMAGFGGALSTGLEAAMGGHLWSAVGTYVTPERRGKGYGKELRAAAMRAAKRMGASCATTGRYPGQVEDLHESMVQLQTLYLVRL